MNTIPANTKFGQNIEDAFVKGILEKDTLKVENIFSNSENKTTLIIKVKAEKLLDELLGLVESFASIGQKRVLINIANTF